MTEVWVEFIETYTVKAEGGPTYRAGTVHRMTRAAAQHFHNRGVVRLLAEDGREAEQPKMPAAQVPPDKVYAKDVNLHQAFEDYRKREGVISTGTRPAVEKPPAQEEKAQAVEDEEEAPALQAKGKSKQPLISCIMPTWNRRAYIKAAVACWAAQTYKNKELIIVDDGTEAVQDLLPKGRRIRYIKLQGEKLTKGMKRNVCCQHAKGDIIAHFDDDDWSAPERLQDQYQRLVQSGKPITGYSALLFWDTTRGLVKRYITSTPGYVVGTSLMYLKAHWEKHPYPDKQEATDNDFVYESLKRIAASYDQNFIVARIHEDHHTSSKEGIAEILPRTAIPKLFWDNELMRING